MNGNRYLLPSSGKKNIHLFCLSLYITAIDRRPKMHYLQEIIFVSQLNEIGPFHTLMFHCTVFVNNGYNHM